MPRSVSVEALSVAHVSSGRPNPVAWPSTLSAYTVTLPPSSGTKRNVSFESVARNGPTTSSMALDGFLAEAGGKLNGEASGLAAADGCTTTSFHGPVAMTERRSLPFGAVIGCTASYPPITFTG